MYTAQRFSELFEHQLGNSNKPPLRVNLAPPYTLWRGEGGGGQGALCSRVLPALQNVGLNCVVMGLAKCDKPGVPQCKRSVHSVETRIIECGYTSVLVVRYDAVALWHQWYLSWWFLMARYIVMRVL